jgi:mannose-6-phosphate isomerase-like protein (cupin superfamily)
MKVVTVKELETTNAYFNPAIKKHIILTSGKLDNLFSLALAVFPQGEVSRAHLHENMGEVFFVQSGRGIIRINDAEFELMPGVCAVVEPNELHEIKNTDEGNLEILYFEVMTQSKEE